MLIYKDFSSVNFSFIGMLSTKTVLLDVEGFRHRKEKFIIKELGICREDYRELTTEKKQSFSWLTRNLHGIEWDTGNYPYIYLTQINPSIRLRNPGAIFYAQGEEKVKLLSDVLECSIIDLNSLACLSISELFYTKLSKSFKGQKQFLRCAKEKAIFYFNC